MPFPLLLLMLPSLSVFALPEPVANYPNLQQSSQAYSQQPGDQSSYQQVPTGDAAPTQKLNLVNFQQQGTPVKTTSSLRSLTRNKLPAHGSQRFQQNLQISQPIFKNSFHQQQTNGVVQQLNKDARNGGFLTMPKKQDIHQFNTPQQLENDNQLPIVSPQIQTNGHQQQQLNNVQPQLNNVQQQFNNQIQPVNNPHQQQFAVEHQQFNNEQNQIQTAPQQQLINDQPKPQPNYPNQVDQLVNQHQSFNGHQNGNQQPITRHQNSNQQPLPITRHQNGNNQFNNLHQQINQQQHLKNQNSFNGQQQQQVNVQQQQQQVSVQQQQHQVNVQQQQQVNNQGHFSNQITPGGIPVGGSMVPVSANQGPCPKPPVVNNFQVHEYAGRWFEIERFFAPFQNGDCVTVDYSFFPNCSISVINSNIVLGQLQSVYGNAVSGPDPSKGELIVSFPGQPGQSMFGGPSPNYGVIATDYENYAVVYSCTNITPTRRFEYSWILGRRERLNVDFLDNLKRWVNQMGVQVERYMPTNQQNCQRRPLDKSINNVQKL